VLGVLRGLTDHDGRTLVMVTHDPVSAAVADRIVFLADGRVVDEVAGASAEGVADRLLALGA
jgi:putative ABC transport system ATP-binding protein